MMPVVSHPDDTAVTCLWAERSAVSIRRCASSRTRLIASHSEPTRRRFTLHCDNVINHVNARAAKL